MFASANEDMLELGASERIVTRCEGSRTGRGRNKSILVRLKIAELAPIANAIEMIAVAANPGFCRSVRHA